MKDQGKVIVRELRELDAAHIAMFDPLKAEVSQRSRLCFQFC